MCMAENEKRKWVLAHPFSTIIKNTRHRQVFFIMAEDMGLEPTGLLHLT